MINFELDDSGLTFLDSLDKYEADKVKYHVVSRIRKDYDELKATCF